MSSVAYGAHRLDFEYDSFGRPFKVKDNANSTNPLKSYTYGTTNTIVSPVPLTVGVASERTLHPTGAGGSGLGARERQETDIAGTTTPRLSPDSQLPTPDVPNTPRLSEPPAPSPEPLSQNDEPKIASRASVIDYQNGRLISAQSDSPSTLVNGAYTGRTKVTEHYAYTGPMGAVTRKTTTVDHLEAGAASFSQVFTQDYGWNALGQLESVSYPNCSTPDLCGKIPGRTVIQSYIRGLLTSVEPYYAKQIVYHPSGMVAKVQHYTRLDVTGTGMLDLIEQNSTTRMARPNRMYTDGATDPNSAADADWSTGTYSYDGAGNVLGMAADGMKTGNDTFAYDKVSRLTSAALAGFGSQSYGYDKFGNLTTYNGSPRTTDTTTNRLSSGTTYDTAGNLTSWPAGAATLNASYDALNQMRALWGNGQNRVFAYTADGERILQRDNNTSTITLRDGSNKVLRELSITSGVWSWKKDYIYRNGMLLASEDVNDGFHHYHLDHLGSSRLVTMRSGEKYTLFTHWPYGEDTFVPSSSSPQDGEKVRYTGHERDLGSRTTSSDDIDYLHARSYVPIIARFMSVDPVRGGPKKPQSWNLFAYVLNNPVILIDPAGLMWFMINGEWTFLKDVKQLTNVTVTASGKMKVEEKKGIKSLITFDGGTMKLFQQDGTTLNFEARAGQLDDKGNTKPQIQDKEDRGPIPEGRWSFNPQLIQHWEHVNAFEKTASLIGRGAWGGGTNSWGAERVWLKPETYGGTRKGFTIHGGAEFGSRGCIDLAGNAPAFFDAVDRNLFYIPVFVDYR